MNSKDTEAILEIVQNLVPFQKIEIKMTEGGKIMYTVTTVQRTIIDRW